MKIQSSRLPCGLLALACALWANAADVLAPQKTGGIRVQTNLVTVLASVLDLISAARINVQEMENVVFDGAQAAVAHINLETAPSADLLDEITSSNPNVLELSLIRLDRAEESAAT